MSKQFMSVYSRHLTQFIDLKRKLRFKYKTGEVILRQIDTMAYKLKIHSRGITSEFASEWCKKKPNESDSYRYSRVMILASFSSFLIDSGIASYVPRPPQYPSNVFIPYIYSKREMALIFKACDKLRWQVFNPNSSMFCFPGLIRVLYATGIRIGEAFSLKTKDVDLHGLTIKVKNSKNGRERILPISQSLRDVCISYLTKRNDIATARNSDLFFSTINGKKISHTQVSAMFQRCLREVGIPYKGRQHGPRLHDLRHTFAVTALASMSEAGNALYGSMQILQNYLGHQSIASTNYYVRLTADMYPELLKQADIIMLDVFPKISNHHGT